MSREKECAICGKSFPRDTRFSDKQWAERLYCSRACTGEMVRRREAAKRPPLKQKFEGLFARGEGCWEWQGTIEGYGYGVIDHARKRYRAHVLALEFDGRPVPKGMVACHHCDNPRCVRPDHLYVGTAKDNATDASKRGRLRAGEAHHATKLTEEQVRQIRLADGSYTDIARRFGVSRPTATRIIKGKLWRNVA